MSESKIPKGNTAMAAPRHEYELTGALNDDEGEGETEKTQFQWGKQTKRPVASFSDLEAEARKSEEKEEAKQSYRPNMHAHDDGFRSRPGRVQSYDFGHSRNRGGQDRWADSGRGYGRSGYDYGNEDDDRRSYGGGRGYGSSSGWNQYYVSDDQPATPVLRLGGQCQPDVRSDMRGPQGYSRDAQVFGGENARDSYGFGRQQPKSTFVFGSAVQPSPPGAQPAAQQQVPTKDWQP